MNSTRGEKINGGFSLVEIVVVIAIMAILVGVLAPAYLRYVEKSRKQKDESAADEIMHATENIVLSGEYTVTADTVLVTYDSVNGVTVQNDPLGSALQKELTDLFGNLSTIKPVSKTYSTKTYTVTIIMPDDSDGYPRISGAWN